MTARLSSFVTISITTQFLESIKASSDTEQDFQNFCYLASSRGKGRTLWGKSQYDHCLSFKATEAQRVIVWRQEKAKEKQYEGQVASKKAKKCSAIEDQSNLKYYNCKKNGQFAWEFPKAKKIYPHPNAFIICVCYQAQLLMLSKTGL